MFSMKLQFSTVVYYLQGLSFRLLKNLIFSSMLTFRSDQTILYIIDLNNGWERLRIFTYVAEEEKQKNQARTES